MKLSEKEKLFKSFQNKWQEQFTKIPYMLQCLSNCPQVTEHIEPIYTGIEEELYTAQLEWVALVAQLNHTQDKDFFKDYWVPVHKNEYSFFIDLSDESFPMFDLVYIAMDPFNWEKNIIYESFTDFIATIEKPYFNGEKYFEQVQNNSTSLLIQALLKREELGIAGKLDPFPIEESHYFIEGTSPAYTLKGNRLIFTGISSIFTALLPFDWNIHLHHFIHENIPDWDMCTKLKKIKTLVFKIQHDGGYSVSAYSFSVTSPEGCKVSFQNSTFTIDHHDKAFLTALIEKYEALSKTNTPINPPI